MFTIKLFELSKRKEKIIKLILRTQECGIFPFVTQIAARKSKHNVSHANYSE